jgi:cell division protein FtsL
VSVRAPVHGTPARAPRTGRPKPYVVPGKRGPRQPAKRRLARRPKLRVVREPSQRRLPFLLVSLVVVGVLISGVAGVQALVSQSSFRADDLSRRIHQLQERQGELELQEAQLSSPKGIADEAKRLGLVLPGPPIVLKVPNKGAAGNSQASGSSP